MQPDKIPSQAKEGSALDVNGNTIKVKISGDNFQPTFYDKKDSLLELPMQIESVVFPNALGTNLNAWLISPLNNEVSTTIFVLHGNAGNVFTQHSIFLKLLEQGYQLAIVDYSGFGFSAGKATRKNTLLDATSFFDYFSKHPRVENTTKILYGQSYGGHLAIVVGQQKQKELAGIIVEGSFTSPKDIAAYQSGFGVFARILTRKMFSAIDEISKIDIPLIVVHSVNDEIIPYEMGEELFSNATEPKLFMKTDNCHICAPLEDTAELIDNINTLILK